MKNTETWYVTTDNSAVDPHEVTAGKDGKLMHKDGRKVAYRPDGVTPRSRSIDVTANREMKPQANGPGYITRGTGAPAASADAGNDLTVLRAEYQKVVGKKPFGGWDAATLREKIAAKAD